MLKSIKLMSALMKTEKRPDCMEVRKIEIPLPKESEVLIRVLAAGVCGTDLHIRSGEWVVPEVPVVMGHEFCGEIAAIGREVKSFRKGDRVVVEPHTSYCGVCEYCLTGRRHLCLSKKGLGIDCNGAFAEYVAIDASLAHKLPDAISPEEAALMEPTAIVCQALLVRGHIRCLDRVAVVGPGPIGIISAQVAQAAGAREVLVIGIPKDREVRLRLCEELGFATYETEKPGNPLELKNKFDVVVEASGVSNGIGLSMELLKKDGQLIVIGIPMEERSSVPWIEAVKKSIMIICSYSSSFNAWEMGLALLNSGKIKLKPLITQDVSLGDWEKAFTALESGKGVKAVLRP